MTLYIAYVQCRAIKHRKVTSAALLLRICSRKGHTSQGSQHEQRD
jgi:hypothetical protein